MPKNIIPVSEYLKVQGRFSHLREKDLLEIQKTAEQEWELLLAKSRWQLAINK
jgi:pyruvate/2-oxoacid:ferredoxin oxidoreductase beta subunit